MKRQIFRAGGRPLREALGNWLAGHWGHDPAADGLIYPQGSTPVTDGGQYDVDLVCRRDIPSSGPIRVEAARA